MGVLPDKYCNPWSNFIVY